MKKTSILFIIALATLTSFAQTTERSKDKFHKNIYLEGLGSSIIAGINYDMRLQRGHMDGFGFRTGVGFVPITTGTLITMPLEFNYLLGKGRNSLVSGIGIVPLYASFRNQTVDFGGIQIKRDISGVALGGAYLVLGYRFQPLRNGLMFQVNWNPILSGNTLSAKWFGISIGYGFK